MSPDLRDYARLLLSREPTRSLPLGVLRERLRQAGGSRWAGPVPLEQALGADPSFRLLRPPPLIDAPASGYAPEVLAVGFPQPEPRVLLVEPELQGDRDPGPFGDTSSSLVALLAREGMRADVAEAIAVLEEIGQRLGEAVMPAPAGHSTTPPPGPPPPPAGARRAPPPAARPPRKPGSRPG